MADTETTVANIAGVDDEGLTPHEAAIKRVDELVGTANRWITERKEIADAEQADKCENFLVQLRAARRATDEGRVAEKKPHDEAAAAVQRKWSPLIEIIDKCGAKLKPLKERWLKKEEDRLAAEAREKRLAVERAQAEAAALEKAAAEEANKVGGSPIEAETMAENARKAAIVAEAQANKAERAKPQAASSLSGRASGLRSVKTAKLTDAAKAAAYYATNTKLIECLESLALAEYRGGRTEIPGFDLKEDKRA